jgi:hypothetical protein
VKRISASVLCVTVALAGACGGASGGIDSRGAKLLDAQIAAARDAAVHGDFARATTLLRALDNAVETLRDQHLVSDGRAREIHLASADTQRALRTYVTITTTTTVTSPTPVESSPGPSPNHKDQPKRGGDQKHGRGSGGDESVG